MKKTASGGYFRIPTGPSRGTAVSSSTTANAYGSWTEMIASTGAAIFIVGLHVGVGNPGPRYAAIDIATGAASSETSIGEWMMPEESYKGFSIDFPFPIPVATATRIAVRVADDESTVHPWDISLLCINQSDLADI